MRRILTAAVLFLALAPATASDAGLLRERIRETASSEPGPDELREQLRAIFDSTEARGDKLARAHLDAASALAETGAHEEAAEHCRRADTSARSDAVRTLARFNLGQLRYRMAVKAMTPPEGAAPDLDTARSQLHASASAFRAALDTDPNDNEAARNVERVRRLISHIEQMQQQAAEQARQLREQADRLDELADRQQAESIQNDRQTQDTEQARQDQGRLNDETQQLREQMQQQAQAGDEALDALDRAIQQQQQAADQLDQDNRADASESQRNATEALREAARNLREQADQQGEPQPSDQDQGEQNQQGEPGLNDQPGEEDGPSRDDQIADWLLDREQRQREQLDRQRRAILARPVPVEQDW